MLGQPILGNQNSVAQIDVESIRKWIQKNYFASNIVVVGTGEIDHEKFVNYVENTFGNVKKEQSETSEEKKEATFTKSCVYIRGEDCSLCNVALMLKAPSKLHEDFFAFKLLQYIWGEYTPSIDTIINDPYLQYNSLHLRLGEYDDITMHKSYYLPYEELGLAGHFFSCFDLSSRYIWEDILLNAKELCQQFHEHEMYRAKNTLYNSLINSSENLQTTFQEIGEQLLTHNRRLTRTEVALRIAHQTPQHLQKVYSKYLANPKIAYSAYGACAFVLHSDDETQNEWEKSKDIPF